jgi:hypothetical protein
MGTKRGRKRYNVSGTCGGESQSFISDCEEYETCYTQEGYRIVFGWVNNPSEVRRKSPADRVWNLALSYTGGALAWDVNRNEIAGASSVELAEKIVMQLIGFRNEYVNSAN